MSKPPPSPRRNRLIGPLGQTQVQRDGLHYRRIWSDVYHGLLRMSWGWLFLTIFVLFFVLNSIFALAYLAGGNTIENARAGNFWDAFFFSVQTLATLGYGKMAPLGFYANLLSSLEVFAGLLSLALITGLVFTKFSRPTARVLFSKVAVIGPHGGVPCLMFRMANARKNQILEARLNLTLLRDEQTQEGSRMRRFYDMALLRKHSPVFSLTWLAIHPIDKNSPIYGLNAEALAAMNAEIVVSLSGTDDTFLQPVYKQHSYLPEEIIWDASFEDILMTLPGGKLAVHYGKFHEVRKLSPSP
jgi:inward rectifier potassium channel